jgi:hypothetical protein
VGGGDTRIGGGAAGVGAGAGADAAGADGTGAMRAGAGATPTEGAGIARTVGALSFAASFVSVVGADARGGTSRGSTGRPYWST